MTLKERETQVRKEKNASAGAKVRLDRAVKRGVRNSTAKALKGKKWVVVGQGKQN